MKRIIILAIIILGASTFLVKGVNAEAIITVDDAQWYTDDGVTPRHFTDIFPDASLIRYYTPLPVFFQGWQSTPREDIVEYVWNFGDGSAEFRGFNGAHVYENPGIYTTTLTVKYYNGITSEDTIQVEALPRDGTTYYVDSATGDDSYDGKCQTITGGCGPWKTATKVFDNMASSFYNPGDNILFKRGQTFVESSNVNTGHWPRYGYMLATFGTGAKPVIQYTGNSTSHMIYHGVGFGHVAFVDLEFRFRNGDGQHSAGLLFNAGGSRNILYLRTDAYDPLNGYFAMQGHGGSSPSTGTFLIDSTVRDIVVYPTSTTLLAYWGARLALLNNYFDNSGNHVAYTSQDKGVIANNIFSRPAFGRNALRIHGSEVNGFENPSNNIVVCDNQFLGWIDPLTEGSAHNGGGNRYNYLLVTLAPNVPEEEAIEYVVFERNIFTNAETMLAVGTAENVTVKNNIFISNNAEPAPKFLNIGSGTDLKPSKNVKIIGNTFVARNQFYSNAVDQNALITINNYTNNNVHPYPYKNHQDISIVNNIFYINGSESRSRFIRIDNDPDLIPQVNLNNNNYFVNAGPASGSYFYIGGTDFSTGIVYTLDQWKALGKDANSIFADPEFIDLVGPDAQFSAFDFDAKLNISQTSPARNAGYLYNTDSFYDFSNYARYEGDNSVDIGAYEFQSSAAVRSDVDQNSITNTTDALLTLRNSLSLSMASTAWVFSATTGDVDCSGISNSTDALLILRYSLGLSMASTAWCEGS